MKTYIGFIFTLSPVQNLKQRGFHLTQSEDNLLQGYRTFSLSLPDLNHDATEIQLRQIVDEELYLEYHKVKHFQPHWLDCSHSQVQGGAMDQRQSQLQDNSVHLIEGSLGPLNATEGDLSTYFRLRKAFDLWALWLQCENFSTFEKKARPDHLFHYQGRKVGLIHLGPNCFDFLIKT